MFENVMRTSSAWHRAIKAMALRSYFRDPIIKLKLFTVKRYKYWYGTQRNINNICIHFIKISNMSKDHF